MSKEDNGGPAFARPFSNDTFNEETMLAQSGMSLRDYIAVHSQAICPINAYEHKEAAEWCYARADAMLEARKI